MIRSLFKTVPAVLLVFFATATYAADFDELDKPPEGAHKGQMLLGAFFSIGMPFGSCLDAENAFLEGSTYTIDAGEGLAKAFEVSHLYFGVGFSFEYMPFDHVGAKIRLKRNSVVQKTNFGSDYENWRGYLYKDLSFYLGPSFHVTTRKRWDFTLTPMIGYAFATYHAAPVASKILVHNTTLIGVTGENERSFSALTYGAELNCTIYFSGGLFVSLGCDWTRLNCSFGEPFNITNPQDLSKVYFDGATSGTIDAVAFILTAGYAFSN
ncbi:MAG TPA: hypothetical protein VLM75_06855 [Spirochaetota bacterium]|nr:hypothetical protein [Spirochaetota bacterium]